MPDERPIRALEGLSHEIRAPLQSMLGHLDLLTSGAFGELSAAQSEALEAVTRSAEKVLAVARDVLQVARIDAGRDEVVLSEVVLRDLLAREIEDIRPLADAAGLALTLECAGDLRLVSDGTKIGRIVTNLLGNAVKFTPSGGVAVSAGSDERGCFVEVADTGVGIAGEHLEAVFDEYFQIGGDRGGTGLGLPICRRLARLLGGRLRLTSEVGKGTVARLDLPAALESKRC